MAGGVCGVEAELGLRGPRGASKANAAMFATLPLTGRGMAVVVEGRFPLRGTATHG